MTLVKSTRKVIKLKGSECQIKEEVIARKKRGARKKGEKSLLILTQSFELGFVLSFPIAGGALLGSYLDRNLGTEPKFTLSLIFMGVFLSIFHIYKLTKY